MPGRVSRLQRRVGTLGRVGREKLNFAKLGGPFFPVNLLHPNININIIFT